MKYIKNPSNQFIKDYKLPLGASFTFVVIVIALLSNRTINRIALTDILGRNSNNDYSKLLSSDKKDDFQKNENLSENPKQENVAPPTISNQSFTVTPNPAPSTATTQTDPSQTTPPPTQNDPGQTVPPPTPPPFTASILGFGLLSTPQYEYCSVDNKEVSTTYRCFKKYSYKGRIKTINGPGTVKYSWEGNFDVINSSGSYSVTSVEAYTDVPKEFKLSCSLPPQQIKIRLKTIEPNFSEAPWQDQWHDCST